MLVFKMTTIAQWKSDAEALVQLPKNMGYVRDKEDLFNGHFTEHSQERKFIISMASHVVALCEVIEKKDVALKDLLREVEIGTVPVFNGSPNVEYAKEALALTEELK